MLAVDFVVYAFLGYYFDQVVPTKDGIGVKKPWNFICKKILQSQKSQIKDASLHLGEEV